MWRTGLRGGLAAVGVGTLAAVLATGPAPANAAAGAWSEVAVPDPSVQFSYLQSVDGRGDTDAWAVGYVQPPGATPFLPIALHWNGTRWSSTSVPQLGDGTILYGVSESAGGDAWAVGNFFTHPVGYHVQSNAAALHWSGGAWTATAVPDSGLLFGVAAVSPTNAWAVGGGVKHWDGSAWSDVVTPSPLPATPGAGSFSAISASGAGDVWAVGSYAPRRHQTAPFSVHFDGKAWQLVPVPTGVSLEAVVAAGPNDAWAVGSDAGNQPAALHWNGTAWTAVPVPGIPAGGSLRGISARAGNDVWAVGIGFTGEANSVTALTLHWNGTAWSQVAVKTPAVSPQLLAVTARPGTTHVWATGSQQPGFPLVLERH